MRAAASAFGPRKDPAAGGGLGPYGPERIYLFGSWARGEEDSLSDLDAVVIQGTATPFLDRLAEMARLWPPDLGAVEVLVYTPEEFARMLENGNALAPQAAEKALKALPYARGAKKTSIRPACISRGEAELVAPDGEVPA